MNLELNQNVDSVTLLIQQRIKRESLEHYELWLPKMMSKAAEYEGHQGVHVIRPQAGGNEFSIIIRFAHFADAERWIKSADRKQLISEIQDSFEVADRAYIHPGIDFWFTPPSASAPPVKAWKQWLITTSVIWPLTLIVPSIYRPLFRTVPLLGSWGISHAIVAATIVALVVFVIMPRYVRAVSKWLHK